MIVPVRQKKRQVDSEALARVTAPVAPLLDDLSSFLIEQVGEFEPDIREMVHYCLCHSGKRIRPLLVFLSGHHVELEPNRRADLVRAAAVVELVHLATLVHDDILDEASMRHGSETVVRKYGAEVAVLLGDALFAQALKLAADFPIVDVCRAVSRATRQVCSGEISQTLNRGSAEISKDEYYRVIDLKTAELFRVSCYLGAKLAGFENAFVGAAARFGRHLGIAYQVYDDLTDFLGQEYHIGKTLGTDLASGKFTLPLILLLEKLPRQDASGLVERILSGDSRTPSISYLVQQMEEFVILGDVKRVFRRELNTAEASVSEFPAPHPAAAMLEISAFVRLQSRELLEGEGEA